MPMTIGRNMLLLNVPFLVFVLCFLSIIHNFLFSLEKIYKLKYYHTVLKAVLEELKFFHLFAS